MTSFTMRETEIGHKNSIGGALGFGGWWMVDVAMGCESFMVLWVLLL